MPHRTVSPTVEDYLTLIWKAHEWPGSAPATTELAASLGVTPSTVSANLKKLARDGLIEYEPYGPIALTEEGRRLAVEVVRRHRIIETYLVECLGLTWDQVHAEADRLEHAVSDLVLGLMDAAIGHPSVDPHGDAIPRGTADGTAPRSVELADAPVGARVRILRVSDRSPEILRYLADKDLHVGTDLVVEAQSEAAGIVRVLHEGSPLDISLESARAVRVLVDRT